jgi:hypothetical protein
MLTEQTIEKLYAMKLNGMAEAFKDQLRQTATHDLEFEDRFALLVDHQWTWKENRQMKRLLQNAHKINLEGESMRKLRSNLTNTSNRGK